MNRNIEMIAVLWHYFKLGVKTTGAACKNWEVDWKETISDHNDKIGLNIEEWWLVSWNKPRTGWSLSVNYDALKWKVKENLTISIVKLSQELGSSKDTICRALHKL